MQPFPSASNLPKFEGDSIAQVQLDPHGVQFALESGIVIACEHRLEQIEPDGSKFAYECVAKDGPPLVLHRLLYRPIQSVRRADLSLTFSIEGGSTLTIFSEEGPYESGNISGRDVGFIVF
jgi:hypothetical protein